MTRVNIGGRGVRAPYGTTHCRIPEAIKSTVESLSAAYKNLIASDDNVGIENLLKSTNEAISNLGEAEEEIRRLKLELALTKTRVESLENEREFAIENLLTAYGLTWKEGVKMRKAIATALPEVKKRYEFLANDKREGKKQDK